MEGRDFSAPAHLLSERATLVHRAASRISSSGHGSMQHPTHFPPGKYYPSHLPMAAHSGSGLMGNSSASFMGTFLASSLGSPPSHPPHPSRPPSSPSSPSYRGGPHSSASQIWFPHSHEAVPGYPRFSGSLAHTFLPISHLEHHANSGVLYGQHRFYDTQKENFYLSLPSQPPLISANHSIQPMSRAGPGQSQGSCSRDRDAGSGVNLHKGLKETSIDRGVVSGSKEKDRSSSKQDSKDRHQQSHHQLPHHHPNQPQLHPQHSVTMEEMNSRVHKANLSMEYKDHPQSMGKPLSACLLYGKMQNGDQGTGAKVSMATCGGDGVGRGNVGSNSIQSRHVGGSSNERCTKEAISGEMRISEQPPMDCLEQSQAMQHSLPYSVPPPMPMGATNEGGHPGGFHCWQLHPSHPHHPHHNRHSHHHPDFFCSPPPAPVGNPSLHDKGINSGGCRDPKVTGATFVPSVSHLGEKTGSPFQMGISECQGVRGGGNSIKEKALEKPSNGGHHGNWPRKQQQTPTQQQHPYRKAEKAPDWMHNHHHHLQQPQQQQQQQNHSQQHQTVRSRSADCINSMETDIYRPTLANEPKAIHPFPNQPNANPQAYRDCSHSGPPTNPSPLSGKTIAQHTGSGGHGSCSMPRDGQKVARIRHQQHGRAGPDTTGADLNQANGNPEMKRNMSPYSYNNNNNIQHHSHQQPSMPSWAMQPHQMHSEEDQHKSFIKSNSVAANNRQPTPQQQHQASGMGPPPPLLHPAPPQNQQEATGSQGENSAMKNLLKYSNQQPLLLSQKTPFGGLGSLKTGPNGTSCSLQGGKQPLPSRKGQSHENERADCGERSREIGEAPHVEGEVRQPPVGIAVAVARQRDPACQISGSHPGSRQGRVHSTLKGTPRAMYPSDSLGEEERKRMSVEQMGHLCLDRERDTYIRDNNKRVGFTHIHPSNSCHGDLTSHIMVPGGTSIQPSQLGDPTVHTHSAHHHWMPRTGSPSLWMTGHSYGIGHTALHQNLPPGFSAAMPAPLQSVLPLPQDPSAQLVVLPSEPATHPASHLDVMEQPGLWPPVYRARGAHSHMQHSAVYSRSQFLRQQELYALQQHHQLHSSHQPPPPSHRAPNNMELQHRAGHSQMQRKPEEQSMALEDILSDPRTPKPAKCYAYGPSDQASSPPRGSTAHLSPCCQSPCMQPHPKSTPSTPCPAPSPVAATPCSPAISPSTLQPSKAAESQDRRVERQPPQDYPQSLEPDLPPGYTYLQIGMEYRNGPMPQDIQLAEPADLEAVQVEPVEHATPALSNLGEGLECFAMVRPLQEPQVPMVKEDATSLVEQEPEFAQGEDMETLMAMGCCESVEADQGKELPELHICPTAEGPVCEVGQGPIISSKEEIQHSDPTVTCEEEKSENGTPQENDDIETLEDQGALLPEQTSVPDCLPNQLPNTTTQADVVVMGVDDQQKNCVEIPSPLPNACSQRIVSSYWSLELLIAAAFCGDCPPPSPPSSSPYHKYGGPINSTYHGMELLSELADLELQQYRQRCGKAQEDQWIFDLQSLATLAAARALELNSQDSSATDAEKQYPAQRTLNLRRKCSWTPRHDPVCPVKGAIDSLDGPELEMRMRLAELQQRYKEKQKELAKLQRKHDHQKEETPRSPARRGPGRPRKRKSAPGLGPGILTEPQKKVKLVGAGLSPLEDEQRGGGDSQRKKKKLSSRGFGRLNSAEMKSQCCRKSCLQDQRMSQLKQKISGGQITSGAASRDRESSSASKSLYSSQSNSKAESTHLSTTNESESLSDTGTSGDSGTRECWKRHEPAAVKRGRNKSCGAATCLQRPGARTPQGRRQDVDEEGETSPPESVYSEQEEDEEEGSYGSEEGQDIKAPAFRDLSFSSSVTGPSPFSVVKLEANQKAKIKRERQELKGSQLRSVTEGDVKVKQRAPCRAIPIPVSKPSDRRRPGRPRLQDKRWSVITGRPGHYRKSGGLLSFPSSTSERLKRATQKSSMLRATRSCYWSTGAESPDSDDNNSTRRTRLRESKGRAISRLLESFAADDGFHLGEDSSFSDEERKSSSHTRTFPAPPNCVLTKELLTDGLKILICKEDELLYAARVSPTESPDVYSIVINGERGNRPRIYSLEQLLHEAVLDVRPESEAVLTEGTRVCAYWSERSRCLYPGYVRRGGAGDAGKPGGVMVEFDDGDRGWISLSNIRFLPPNYQIQCADSDTVLVSDGQFGRSSSTQDNGTLSKRTTSTDRSRAQDKPVRGPGRPKGSGLRKSISNNVVKSSASSLNWSSLDAPRRRTPINFFQLNGSDSKKALKGRVAETSSRPSVSMTTPAKGIFSSSSFEVDSFSSIANGYSCFRMSLEGKNTSCIQKSRTKDPAPTRGRKAEFLVKLDHEGVTSPKTKSSKALLLLRASGFGSNCIGGLPRTEVYSHPVLLVKDNRKGDGSGAELLLKGTQGQRKPSPTLRINEYKDLNLGCHRDCHSSYSDMDEEDQRRTVSGALTPASGGLRTAGRFISSISVSSSSSGSSSSSSSGSLSSSSLCSSDNDSSYSSEDEESSTLLLQSCLTPHHSLIQTPEPPSGPPRHSFVAKAVAVSSAKGGSNSVSSKPQKRKECPSSLSKTSKELLNRQRHLTDQTKPRLSPILPSRQLWRWSGNPAQHRGSKGKAQNLFYKAIVRGKDMVRVGDCAVFLSAGQPHLPLIGRIESFWESWQSSMVVKVKWFYHPEETKLGNRHRDGKHALYQSCHEDENDVQTISHKCQVVSREEYEHLTCNRKSNGSKLTGDLYYLAGTYDPTNSQLLTADGMSLHC
ncbi:BAH and coiled-coil domain-containing protein 1-like [Xyrauchen texanus]|uniref:BAH and coiled-coil domain-containing protein 1-like n=1 Tax=Xyrauchen texanus TaxID=154827 RepID=UPI0022428B2D|nr:BAH and coiled-coil domain-containing protein 1-like [Xyrauchen texanus]